MIQRQREARHSRGGKLRGKTAHGLRSGCGRGCDRGRERLVRGILPRALKESFRFLVALIAESVRAFYEIVPRIRRTQFHRVIGERDGDE